MNLQFRELVKKDEMLKSYSLLSQIYKNLSEHELLESFEEMIESTKYRILAAFLDGKMVAVSGFWIARMLYCGRYLQASNFVVDESLRGLGIGKKLLESLEEIARSHDCQKFVLDSHTENRKSHPFYFECGFYIRGFHFMKDL